MNSKIPEYVIDSKRKEEFKEQLKLSMQINIAVVDMSEILKFLQKIYENKNIIAQREWQIIEDLCTEYDTVIIPTTVLNEIVADVSDVQLRNQILRNIFNYGAAHSTRLILKRVSPKQGVIVRDYSRDDIFDFAKNTSTEFNCPVDIITCDTHVGTRIKYTVEVF